MQSPAATPPMRTEPATGETRGQMSTRLQGSLLIVDGKPFAPAPFNGKASRCNSWHALDSTRFNFRRSLPLSKARRLSDRVYGSWACRRGPMKFAGEALVNGAIA